MWSEIFQTGCWWAPYETKCFVSDRPTAINWTGVSASITLEAPQ